MMPRGDTPSGLCGFQAKQYMLRQDCWSEGVHRGFPAEHLRMLRWEFPNDPIDVMFHEEHNTMELWVFGAQVGPQHILTIRPGEVIGSVIDRLRESRHNALHRNWKAWLSKTKTDMRKAEKEQTRKAVELEDPEAIGDAWMKARGKGRIQTSVPVEVGA